MRRLIYSCFIATVLGTCPNGFDLVRNGQCQGTYGTATLPENTATYDSTDKCDEIGGQLPVIHSAEENAEWLKRIKEGSIAILGLICNTSSTKWEWVDGSPLNYIPQRSSSDFTKACKTGCSPYISGKIWDNVCYSYTSQFVILCSVQLQQPVHSDDDCESFDDDDDNGKCYQVGAAVEDWKEAEMTCRSYGGELASIHNQQENSFIRRVAVSRGAINGMFLGATTSGKGETFAWTDGSDWDYDNFSPGFPFNGLGECVAMDPQVGTGQWVNANCASNFSVACERSKNYTASLECPPGPWTDGDVIHSPGYPFDASIPCDYIISVSSGKKVQAEILLLEANSCCDHLILYDNYIGGSVIANYTGEISNQLTATSTTNFMRVSWQPNGGVNVRGMVMTFRRV